MALIKRYGNRFYILEIHRNKNGFKNKQREWIDGKWITTAELGNFKCRSKASNSLAKEVASAEDEGYIMPEMFMLD